MAQDDGVVPAHVAHQRLAYRRRRRQKACIVSIDSIPTRPVVRAQRVYVRVGVVEHTQGGVTLRDRMCKPNRQDFKTEKCHRRFQKPLWHRPLGVHHKPFLGDFDHNMLQEIANKPAQRGRLQPKP